MAKPKVLWFNGTCSNCRKHKVPVLKVGSDQCCGLCISKFKVPKNIFKVEGR